MGTQPEGLAGGSNLDGQVRQWRNYVQRRATISLDDVDEMEDHLRERVGDLMASGLSADEAFLVAVKRLGTVDALAHEFAVEHSERLWKQLVLPSEPPGRGSLLPSRELLTMLAFAVGSALTLTAGVFLLDESVLMLNVSMLVWPFLVTYFAWKRQVAQRVVAAFALPFGLAALALNLYPFTAGGATQLIAALHAPIALWFVVGIAYAGGDWRSDQRRMDFVRFTGECFVYFTLLGLGGGVLIALTAGTFQTLGIDMEWVIEDWILPAGVGGAVIVAAWLVEAKQNVVENIAPVLTRVFTPLTTLMLLALVAAFIAAGDLVEVDRDLLILVDLILVLVLGLLLYAMSARDPHAPPDLFDRLQLLLLGGALAVDVLMLTAMLWRIAEFGVTANKATALGLNVLLLVNLVWSLRLGIDFIRGRTAFSTLERWQMRYLPAHGTWAAAMVVLLPVLFAFS